MTAPLLEHTRCGGHAVRCAPAPLARALASGLAALALSLAGCAAFDGYPQRITDPDLDLKELQDHLGAGAIAACVKEPALACRNRIIGARMYAIDVRFSQFEEALFRDTRRGGFNTTLGTLGLTTAAAASTGGAAQVLSGLGALLIGGREAFQKEVLSERTVIALHTGMRARRAEVALRLRTGLQKPLADYSLGLALGDLDAYYNAGTVLGALVGITENVGTEAKAAETALRKELSFNLDAEAQKLRALVCGPGPDCPAPRTTEYPRIQACWPQVGVPSNARMTDFMLEPRFTTERGLVAKCLGL